MKSNSGPSIVWRELNFYVYSNRVVFRSRVVEFTNKQSAIKLFLLFIHEYTKKHNPDEFATVHHDCCGGFFHFSEEKEVVRLFLSPCLSRKVVIVVVGEKKQETEVFVISCLLEMLCVASDIPSTNERTKRFC